MNWPRLYFYMNIYDTKIGTTFAMITKIVFKLSTIALCMSKIGCKLAKIVLTCHFSM